MERAIDSIKSFEEHRNLMHLADAQADFLRRYSGLIQEDLRFQFERELMYLIHLAYREAQQPLTKQLTDFVTHYNRPLIIEREKP